MTFFITKMIKKDGKLTFKKKSDKAVMDKAIENLREGQAVEMVIDFTKDDGRLGQISKIHAMIGDISAETGDDYEEIKKEVKKKAGLYTPNEELKSFANCSSQELSLAIQAAINLGEFLGMNLN